MDKLPSDKEATHPAITVAADGILDLTSTSV